VLFQDSGIPGEFIPFIYAGVTFGLMILSWIPLLKIGLMITKAEVKKKFSWVVLSACIQAGAVFFIMLPIFLSGFTGEMEHGPDIGLIIGIMCIGLFIDLNIINVLHEVGILRALFIFILEIIPVIIIMSMMFADIGMG
jgi:hypothetical protein